MIYLSWRDCLFWIEEQAEIFCQEVKHDHLVDGVIITDSWLNVCGPGGVQNPHYHANSYLSGIYYVNFDADIHAPTYFYKTQNSHMFAPSSPNIALMTDKNTQYTEPQPFTAQEGELILWSSELIHGYKPNQGDTRVTLSFNIMPKIVTSGEYGWKVEKLSPKTAWHVWRTKNMVRYGEFHISNDLLIHCTVRTQNEGLKQFVFESISMNTHRCKDSV